MNRSNQSHRLTPTDFQIMARQKLQLPIFPHEDLCKCNKQHDIFGDHSFFCTKTHKGSTHNILTNELATTLPLTFVEAQIAYPCTTMDIKPKLHLNANVLAPPLDISFTPIRSEHPSSTFTTMGFNVTITKVPNPPTNDTSTSYNCITTLTANAESNLWRTNFSSNNKPRGALPLRQFLIGGWKEVRWVGVAWVGVSGQENGLTLRGGLRIYREEINPTQANKTTPHCQ